MASLCRHTAIGVGLLATVVLLSCEKSPTGPIAAISVVRVELSVPSEIAPGTSVQLSAKAIKSDNSIEDVTAKAEWSSSNPGVLTVNAAGVANAIANGEAQVIARYARRSDSAHTFVLPIGTFRLTGQVVTESGAGISGVTVRIISGVGEGLTASTGVFGDYALYGVGGRARIQAMKNGYRSEIGEIDVTAHRTFDFRLAPEGSRRNLEGTYTLTIAAGQCSGPGTLPQAARTRTYTATVAQTGERLDVLLTDADFIVTGGRGDRFSGVVDPNDQVTFVVGHDDGTFYYFYTAEYDVVERFTDRALIVHGTVVATATLSRISGTLSGAINLSSGTAPPFLPSAYCRGLHRFDMVRR